MSNKKTSIFARVLAIVLAALMVLGGATYAIYAILGLA